MAGRDRANLNTNIWTDDHWRTLTRDQQWLYQMILTHPELSYAGVADWRPGRLMQFAAGTSRHDIERIGAELQAQRFIFIDNDTEEVLVRSFTRHDGLLKQPKLTVSMVNAYGAVSSNDIRAVFIFELRRLHNEYPELKAFENRKVLDLLKQPARNMDEFTQGFTPAFTLGFTPDVSPPLSSEPAQGLAEPTTTATTTSTSYEVDGVNSPSAAQSENRQPGMTGTRIPNGFKATNEMIAWAIDNAPNIDVQLATKKFKAHYRSAAGPAQFKTDWTAAWEAWLLGDQAKAASGQPLSGSERRLKQGYELTQRAATRHSPAEFPELESTK